MGAQDRSELGFGAREGEHPARDVDDAAGEREGVGRLLVEHVEAVAVPAARGVAGDALADRIDVSVQLGVVDDAGLTMLRQLGFHTVAALLNAESDLVDYLFTTQEVIDMFDAVHDPAKDPDDPSYEELKDTFAFENEKDCPLD